MNCCLLNQIVAGSVTDTNPPEPPEAASLWYAELTGIVWNSADAVTINGVLADVVFDNPALGNEMQAQFGANSSGCWMLPTGNKVFIWIYQTGQPTTDTIEVINFGTGLPIDLVWQQGASDLISRCFEASINIADPPATNTGLILTDEGFDPDFNVSGASFDNPNLVEVLANIFHQTFGAESILAIEDHGGGEYVFKIQNTLIIPTQIQSTAAESGNFAEVSCP